MDIYKAFLLVTVTSARGQQRWPPPHD